MTKITQLLLLTLLCANLSAQEIKINTKKITHYLQTFRNNNRFNGEVLIAHKNKVIYRKSFGYANNESKRIFNKNTKFQLASLSKQFTSSGILILEQEKKLSIHNYVSDYLPNFPYKNITIQHLMSHTSGLPNFVNSMWKDLDTTKVNGNKEMFEMFASKKYALQWKPGEKWEYCDIGYCTLASLIEKVSGKSYKNFMKEKIFDPANMSNTSAEHATDYRAVKTPELAMGYVYDTKTNNNRIAYETPENSFVYWLGGFYGDGSVISTLDDLLKWDKSLYENNIISKKSLKKATTPAKLNDGKLADAWGSHYGLGWTLFTSKKFGEVQSHSGQQPGYNTRLTRCPEKELTIIIAANMSIPKFWEIDLLKELEKQL
ncbi:serine hydrolase domain-containing protein [Tenacibaculum sp. MAR_2009_124]|uniref:serine hydrolase domain-containing protein n=1 Tax=Tenacibaculum sp. MAR_2009_124 TaxID=1250059 RepID=UPI000B8123CB|nr:serine hydrolase domain-containing protein [Tenacibaculum sp. MAR_2009_124]